MKMEDPIAENFEEFLKKYYSDAIAELSVNYPTQKSLNIEYLHLDQYSPKLASMVRDEPDEMLELLCEVLQRMDLASGVVLDGAQVRVIKVPNKIKIRDIRNADLGKIVAFEGIALKATAVQPQMVVASFECPYCHHIFNVVQPSSKAFREPYECDRETGGCGRKAQKFKLRVDESAYIDSQKIRVQEPIRELRGGDLPRTIDVQLTRDLAGMITPGERIVVNGILRGQQKVEKGVKTSIFEVYVDAISVEKLEKVFEEIKITEEDEQQIRRLAKDPLVYERLEASMAPTIYGLKEVKQALLLQLFGSSQKYLKDGRKIRGDIHILLVGDAALGKSAIIGYQAGLAPRGIYTTGGKSSAAGLTAAVVHDEFGGGRWSLEAGTMALADKGLVALDEADKMRKEDRDALYESMEQQSFHRDFVLTTAQGDKEKIGKFVDKLMVDNEKDIIRGVDCDILPLKGATEVMTTDFHTIFSMPINRVSRHKAPSYYIEFLLQTGRKLKVTPEHPCWVVRGGEVLTIPAVDVVEGELFPIPTQLPVSGVTRQPIKPPPPLKGYRKPVRLPDSYSPELCRLLGYHVSDGGYALGQGVKTGLNFSNNNTELIDDYIRLAKGLFGLDPYIRTRGDSKALFYYSQKLVDFMTTLDKRLMDKKTSRRIPPTVFKCSLYAISNLLRALFDGDGGVYFVQRNGARVTVTIVNYEMAEQVQDLLSLFGIRSTIFKDRMVYKVDISGSDNLHAYYNNIGFSSSKKQGRLKSHLEKDVTIRTRVDIVPNVKDAVLDIAKQLRISLLESTGRTHERVNKNVQKKSLEAFVSLFENRLDAVGETLKDLRLNRSNLEGVRRRFNIPQSTLAREMGVASGTVGNWERNGIRDPDRYCTSLIAILVDMQLAERAVNSLSKLASGAVSWCEVKSVKNVPNSGEKWVYDVTVEPYHAFISNNLILHNTISISKAGIIATLNSRCALLAAANPKTGRFYIHEPIADQIDMPPTLLSRFDLIFTLLDTPDQGNDTETAAHVLNVHLNCLSEAEALAATKAPSKSGAEVGADGEELSQEFIRKYIAFAKRSPPPKLSLDASKRFEDFYVQIRSRAYGDVMSAIPITIRQLESLVRLSEARARARLGSVITEGDADSVIALYTYCMKAVYTDPESGDFDVEWVTQGTSQTRRNRAQAIRTIVSGLTAAYGLDVPITAVLDQAEQEGIERVKAEEMVERMIRESVLYSPSNGVVRFVG